MIRRVRDINAHPPSPAPRLRRSLSLTLMTLYGLDTILGAGNGEGSRRLKALKLLICLHLKLVLDKLAETPDKPADSIIASEK